MVSETLDSFDEPYYEVLEAADILQSQSIRRLLLTITTIFALLKLDCQNSKYRRSTATSKTGKHLKIALNSHFRISLFEMLCVLDILV